jgi:hypothetical protein
MVKKKPPHMASRAGKSSVKPSKRKFYRSVIQVEVLSEEPVYFDNLTDVHHAITNGACSGSVNDLIQNEVVDGPRMAALLMEQASDPGFFRLTEDGEEADEDESEEEDDE